MSCLPSPLTPPLAPPARLRRAALAGACAWAAAAMATPPSAATAVKPGLPTQTLAVPGLAAPAEILLDPWGVPHLYAASRDDLFFVQGFNAARDRLFQIDLWRRRGLGRLAAALGPAFVETDRAARLFLYRGDMAREWAAYGPEAKAIVTRFVAGINAYVARVAAEPARLPAEFRQFGYAPEPWAPEDVLRIRSHALAGNLYGELWRATLHCRGELTADRWRQALTPPRELRAPEGLDACVPPEALREYLLATQPVQMPALGSPQAVPQRSSAAPSDETLAAQVLQAAAATADRSEGSNAWAIAPGRSASGRPLLAADPHRLQAAPALRYLVHLEAPGYSAIGGGEPAVPGISMGHNGRIAFGLTVFAADQEDLYVYETRPGAPDEYRYRGGWEKMRLLTETIEVRGAPAQTVTLRFTRHGPVTGREAMAQRAYAVRSVWFEPGTAPYLASLGLMRAADHASFQRGLAAWGTPAVNMVYADTRGDIAWAVGARVPRRPNWDGLMPVPGDGRYEWAGFRPAAELPALRNPAAGWFASANEYNLPAEGPWQAAPLGHDWPSRARHQRLAEVLSANPRFSVDDAVRLQSDVLSVPARRVQALLRTLRFSAPAAQAAQRLLGTGWNAQLTADSGAAALFERWWTRHLPPAFRQAVLSPTAAMLLRTSDEDAMLAALENPATAWGAAGAVARRDAVLETSLAAAWADLVQSAGPEPARWQWGALHQAVFPHPLAPGMDAATQARFNVGPYAKAGGRSTVNLSVQDSDTGRHVAGPSLRLVLDVGDWDRSRAINAPGQAGDPASPHYRDLALLWLKGETVPLLYSRAAVQAAAVQRWVLQSASAARGLATPASAATRGR